MTKQQHCTCWTGQALRGNIKYKCPLHSDAAEAQQPEIERLARALCKSKTCRGIACCEHPSNMGERHNCPVRKGNYNDGVRDVLEALMENAPAETELWLWELLNEDKP